MDVDLFTPKVMAKYSLLFKTGISNNSLCYLCKIDQDIHECLGFRGEKEDSLYCFLQDIISTVLNSKTSHHPSENMFNS